MQTHKAVSFRSAIVSGSLCWTQAWLTVLWRLVAGSSGTTISAADQDPTIGCTSTRTPLEDSRLAPSTTTFISLSSIQPSTALQAVQHIRTASWAYRVLRNLLA